MTALLKRVLREPKMGRYLMISVTLVAFVVLWGRVAGISGASIVIGKPTFIPTTISGILTTVEVQKAGDDWVNGYADRYWASVADTGSMLPYFSSHSLLLCVKYSGQPFRNGSVLIFNRGDKPHVVHVAVDQTATHVYMSGVNNHESDGWYSKKTIEGIVVGQYYLP